MLKNEINRSPVCIFLFNKYHLIDRFLRSIKRCNNFKKHKIFIFSDSFSKLEDKNKVIFIRKKISEFKKLNKNVQIIFRNKNFGLKKNIISGVNEIINKYKRTIVIEDDLLLAEDFLDYMNLNLNYYKNKKAVFSISGYSPNFHKTNKYQNFFSYTPSSWGWATWLNRWRKFKPVYKLDGSKLKKVKRKFQLTNYDNYISFKDINIKKRDLWSANFTYASLINKSLNSFPIKSRVSNIGFDGSGQGGISKRFSHKLTNNNLNKICLNSEIKINKKLDQKLLSHFKKNNFFILIKYFIPLNIKKIIKKYFITLMKK